MRDAIRLSYKIFRVFTVLALFFYIYFAGQIADEVNTNFNQAVTLLNVVSMQTKAMEAACQPPLNEKAIEKTKEILFYGSTYLMGAQENLGHLISPATYCSLQKIITSSTNASSGITPCSSNKIISDEEVNQTSVMLDNDHAKFNRYTEYFSSKRYQAYSDKICK